MIGSWESADKKVRKNVLKLGTFSTKPTECATCKIFVENISAPQYPDNVNGTNELLDSEILKEEGIKTIVIGEAVTDIDRNVERAVQMMMINEKSLVTIHYTHINDPSETSLVVTFDITLIDVQPFKPIWEWMPEEKYKVALKYKEIGISLFKDCKYVYAFHKFSKACKILITLEPISDLELEDSLEKKINELRLVLYNNMASCQLNRCNYEHTITLCTKVLEKDKNNVKALYRRGTAYGNLKDIEKAVADLKCVTILEPENIAAKKQFNIYNKKLQEANRRFEDMVKRMFKV